MTPPAIERLNAALTGRYRVESELGEGGMATVYLADDLKHERKVALKVLKPELAAVVGAERFLAEIKTTANLQHPHILPLFDSGEADGYLFYVMPYVEGETLRQRIDRERQLPVDEALGIATAVAGALQTAHEQGVVHRDIKPGNILLSRGQPLVADFGIALAVSAGGGGRLTETGLSLGTPFYMSPEQATGDQAVGPASDTFAVACVLYEMLTGEPPYPGSTAQAVLGKIIQGLPVSATAVRQSVPANVDAAIRKALEKLPADRFSGAQDFANALGDPAFRHGEDYDSVGAGRSTVWNPVTVAMTAVAIVTTTIAAWALLRPLPPSPPGVVTRAEVTGRVLYPPGGRRLAISPDGRWIVAGHLPAGLAGAGAALYVREAADPEWRLLDGTGGGSDPTFSPDGEEIAFNVQTGIFKVPVTGGPVLPVATGTDPQWTPDGDIVYRAGNGVYRIPASGDDAELLFSSDSIAVAAAHLLPNGRAVVFSNPAPVADSRVFIFEIETQTIRELLPAGTQPYYVPTGHLIYGLSNGVLMGVPFDLETLQRTGAPDVLLPALDVNVSGAAQFAVAESGTLIYALPGAAADQGGRLLVEVDMAGAETVVPLSAGATDTPRYSPDGRRIAHTYNSELRVYDALTGASPSLAIGTFPVWSPAGEHLYHSQSSPISDSFRRPVDASAEAIQLWQRATGTYVTDVSAGDTLFVVRENAGERGHDMLLGRAGPDSVELIPFVTTEWNESNGDISPDGRWVAYQSDEGGEYRIYVHSFPEITGRRTVSAGLGVEPVWAPDGSAIYYRSGSRFMAIDVTTDPTFQVLSAPRVLFDEPLYIAYANPGLVRPWDLHPDGTRFVMMKSPSVGVEAGVSTAEIYLVTNWFEEVRQRMGN